MGTLIVTEFITLDGVVDSPGGGPHPHAGWSFRHVTYDEAAYELMGISCRYGRRPALRFPLSRSRSAGGRGRRG